MPGNDKLEMTDGEDEGMFESMENIGLFGGNSFMFNFSKSFSKRNWSFCLMRFCWASSSMRFFLFKRLSDLRELQWNLISHSIVSPTLK